MHYYLNLHNPFLRLAPIFQLNCKKNLKKEKKKIIHLQLNHNER